MFRDIHANSRVQQVKLLGCSTLPLASYLKAIGILRIIAEQEDPAAQGWWSGDVLILRSTLDEAALCRFFLEKYRPTPIVVPWSGNDFFAANRQRTVAEFNGYWKEKKPPKPVPTAETVIEAILATESTRLEPYRKMIREVFAAMDASNTREKKDIEGQKGEEQKRLFLTCLRSRLSDDLVSWLDAAVALGTDDFSFNTLLGSGGGSDGNSHFSDNFMQSIWICLPDFDAQRRAEVRASDCAFSSEYAIRMALFAEQSSQAVIRGRSPGLFSSQDVGGPNSIAGFDSEASFNPWNYILLLEGCLAFSGSLAKRVGAGTSGDASFPFLMRLCNAGSGTLIVKETSGRELWLPLWERPLSFAELSVFLAEGRLSLGQEYVRTGLDAARAVASLGYDRGISSFQRIGIVRGRVGGDNYNTAIALGSWSPQPNEQVDLISEIDTWLNSFRRAATSNNAPSRAQRVLRNLESAILSLCQRKDSTQRKLQAVLIALGEAEETLCVSAKWRTEFTQRPVPLLSPKWLSECDDNSAEFRLAVSLAAMTSPAVGDFRQYLESVEIKGKLDDRGKRWVDWNDDSFEAANIVWTAGDLESNLTAVLNRRIIQAMRQRERLSDDTAALAFPGQSLFPASIGDIGTFLKQNTDGGRSAFDGRIALLLRGLILLDWDQVRHLGSFSVLQSSDSGPPPDATFSLLKLCHTPDAVRGRHVRLEPSISRLAAAGRPSEALAHAVRRLIGSELPPAIRVASRDARTIRRMNAALLFPVSSTELDTLANTVLRREPTN